MGLRYNPFNGSFDFTRSPGSYLDGEVATFADLPLSAAAAPLNSAWLVREASGLYFLTRRPAGIYIRTATGGTDRNADYTYASAFPDVFSDANFTVYDDADSTKNLQFQLSGITTGTTRTLTVPDASGTLPLLETANTFTQNQTLNGTNNVAPNQTAGSGSSIMTRDLVDARVGDWPAGQTVSVWNNIVYTVGTTAGKRLRGTISLPNNTETKLFNATAFGVGRVGLSYYVYGDTAAVGRGSLIASARGNQGDTEINDTNNVAVFSNSTYWVAFGSAVTLTTGDTLTGNVTGATAKVWHSSALNNTSRTDVWLYDVTGIFSSADTNVERNGTPTGVGISNSVWGASPAAGNVYFFYQTRDTSGNIMPACFQRQGGARVLLFDIQAF
jgi:hypothetical protein